MRPFSFLYRKVMSWARHRHAPRYLFALSFAESSFFPVPPDVMLAPMALGRPDWAEDPGLRSAFEAVEMPL